LVAVVAPAEDREVVPGGGPIEEEREHAEALEPDKRLGTAIALGLIERGYVERDDLMTPAQEVADDIDAQESGAAGDEVASH